MRMIPNTWAATVYMEVRARIPQLSVIVNGMPMSWAAMQVSYDNGIP